MCRVTIPNGQKQIRGDCFLFGNFKDNLQQKMNGKLSNLKSKKKTKQEYMPDDYTYRDLYNEPDQHRASRLKTKSFSYGPWMTLGAFVGIQLGVWIVFGALMSIFHNFGNQGAKYSMIGSIEYLMFYSPHRHLIFWSSFLLAFFLSACFFYWLWRNWKVQNLMYDTSDLNQYHDTARLTQPEELIKDYDVVPDSGAHSKKVNVSAILGHMMINNKGIKKVTIPKRYEHDVLDENGNVIHARKSLILDKDGNPIMETVPMFDEKFADTLFDSAMLPKKNTEIGKKVRKWYDPTTLDYNMKKQFGKQNYDTLADLINNDWYMPDYEVQRPGGVYVVDSQPNNTMVCQHC